MDSVGEYYTAPLALLLNVVYSIGVKIRPCPLQQMMMLHYSFSIMLQQPQM